METATPTVTALWRPHTKIMATLGPATSTPETIVRLLDAGASVVRLNFSHGTLDDHGRSLETVRRLGRERRSPVAVVGDLQGPKIRVITGREQPVDVATGSTLVIARGQLARSGEDLHRFACTDPSIIDDVRPGQRLLVDDGRVRCLVVESTGDEIMATVTHGGPVGSGKGINLPDTDLRFDTLTERDHTHVRWAVEHELDYLALSFVRSADDVRTLADLVSQTHDALGGDGRPMPIIAKIEVPRAVERIESILDVADAIMVARGDLGVEMDLAEVPVIQKRLIRAAQDHGKPCIIATQMLESMIERSTPTRAEASDVAGAIYDRVDAVMLSGETAVGRFPSMAVEHMRRIAERTEAHLATQPVPPSPPARLVESRYQTAALAHGVWTIAYDVGAVCVVVWSQEGGGARYLSQNNCVIPILAITSDVRAARRMQLYRSVSALRWDVPDGLSALTERVDVHLLESGRAHLGDPVILMAGEPLGLAGVTNSLAIHIVGNPDSGYAHHR